jgi:LysM repeat protein
MSIAPVLPPEIVALPAGQVTGAVVIPFRHRAPEPASEPDLAPDGDPQPEDAPDRAAAAADLPATRRAPRVARPVDGGRRRAAGAPMARDAVRPGQRVVRAARPHPTGLRLTRRGKVVLTVAGLLAALAFGMLSARLVQTQGGVPDSAPAVVQVQPGDTLWSIAERVAPQADTRAVVDTIAARNGLVGGAVHPGQRLVIHP